MGEEIDPEEIARAVGDAIRIKDHVDKDHLDQCAYCGQHFGPENVVIQKEYYGREWAFCSEECLHDFRERTDFKDENLDADPDVVVNIKKEDSSRSGQ